MDSINTVVYAKHCLENIWKMKIGLKITEYFAKWYPSRKIVIFNVLSLLKISRDQFVWPWSNGEPIGIFTRENYTL